jgi:hypothetical protein
MSRNILVVLSPALSIFVYSWFYLLPYVGIWAKLNICWPKFNWKAKVMCMDDMWTLVPHCSSRLMYSTHIVAICVVLNMRTLKDMKTVMDTHTCASRFYACVPCDLQRCAIVSWQAVFFIQINFDTHKIEYVTTT